MPLLSSVLSVSSVVILLFNPRGHREHREKEEKKDVISSHTLFKICLGAHFKIKRVS